jgi:hypothetical protein
MNSRETTKKGVRGEQKKTYTHTHRLRVINNNLFGVAHARKLVLVDVERDVPFQLLRFLLFLLAAT